MNLSWNMDRISPKYSRYGYRRGPCWCSGEGRQARVVAKYIGGCGALRCYCSIQPNGLVTPCVYMPSCIVGDLRKSRFAEIWDHPLEAAFSDREDRGDHCGVCDYRAFCGGCRARADDYIGDMLAGDPGCIHNRHMWDEISLRSRNMPDAFECLESAQQEIAGGSEAETLVHSRG